MIVLPKDIQQVIEETYQGITLRSDKIIAKLPKEKATITIPSKLYPLSDKKTINLFSYFNTEELEDAEVIKEVFNSLELNPGRCYSNTENLREALSEKGIEELETYVGWILMGELPIHHCWLVYKGKHVLDGGLNKLDMMIPQMIHEKGITDRNEQRKFYADMYVEYAKKPNSETKTFGQAIPVYVYVGTKCEPDKGRDIYNKLIAKYPNHPAYAKPGQNINGASATQELIMQGMKKDKQKQSKPSVRLNRKNGLFK